MPIVNGCLKLEQDAPFEEIEELWYRNLLENVPPEIWRSPYQNLGWFICGEPHTHDSKTGEAYHYLCFNYNGKYYAGCRSVNKSSSDYENEIYEFCCKCGAVKK